MFARFLRAIVLHTPSARSSSFVPHSVMSGNTTEWTVIVQYFSELLWTAVQGRIFGNCVVGIRTSFKRQFGKGRFTTSGTLKRYCVILGYVRVHLSGIWLILVWSVYPNPPKCWRYEAVQVDFLLWTQVLSDLLFCFICAVQDKKSLQQCVASYQEKMSQSLWIKWALCNSLKQFPCINHLFIGHMWWWS